jgi:restriction endonuclease Mrr
LPWVVTNSGYTQQAIELANTNQVELIDGKKLADMLAKTNVSWREVYEMEHHRMG